MSTDNPDDLEFRKLCPEHKVSERDVFVVFKNEYDAKLFWEWWREDGLNQYRRWVNDRN